MKAIFKILELIESASERMVFLPFSRPTRGFNSRIEEGKDRYSKFKKKIEKWSFLKDGQANFPLDPSDPLIIVDPRSENPP